MTPGTVLITGPTGGLGRETTLALARRPHAERPDLLLVGRPGDALSSVAAEARAEGAVVHDIGADLTRLSDVRAAAGAVGELVAAGQTRPLRGLIANAGLMSVDTHTASADGYELTFAVNYLAHAQLIGELRHQFSAPARIVLVGSNTYHQNIFRKILHVAPARWRDPIEIARPLPPDEPATMEHSGIAYSNAKLAILYYAHELQRHLPDGVTVAVFEPGFMPGTGLSRGFGGAAVQRIGRAIQAIPGVSSPARSGPLLASVAVDARWAHLKDGAFVVKNAERPVQPFAHDRVREQQLWAATAHLLPTLNWS
ncbi:short-chain dehydrogenase [Mycolicibacterium canariasense]|uniref:Short-chain dehydrogenase n=2 Tax=Mycolicibacterium canariasense TaxID=228230 RepID=A0A100WBZ0_MYCCR|nr:SDR family NAD(P)-dependent oxidoreductase [Mycolicibacterium canariasense]ORV05911.1 short-chain dehydrogenase [Mycolicibacterium canariasense]GAS95221.1 short-chain dehydrogenase [Mycolicibacterium canariasense]